METQAEKRLSELQQLGAIEFNSQKLPVYCTNPPQQSRADLNQILRLLIQSQPDNDELKRITEQDLDIACRSSTLRNPQATPKHYQPPITRFGTAKFSESDLHFLRQVRKDHSEVGSVDRIFDIIREFHEENDYKFSEETWLKYLHIPMPSEARPLIYNAQRLKSPLSLLFEDLATRFSKVRDNPTIISALFSITRSPSNILSMLEEMVALIDSSCQSKEEMESLAIHEAFKVISDTVGAAGASSVKVAFFQLERKTIRNLSHLASTHFKDLLNTKTKFHHLAELDLKNPVPAPPPPQPENKQLGQLVDSINRLVEYTATCFKCKKVGHLSVNCPNQVEMRTCHKCGIAGHIASQCRNKAPPQPRNPPSVSNRSSSKSKGGKDRPSYSQARCSIHPGSNHLNRDCKDQVSPCTYRPNHGNHSLGQCKRDPNSTLPNVPVFSSPAQALFQQTATVPAPSPPATLQQIASSTDHATRAKLIDLLAAVK